jgi:hypothetical protein
MTCVLHRAFGDFNVRSSAKPSAIFNLDGTIHTMVHAFVSSRMDYCNSLLYGIADGLVQKLQSIDDVSLQRSRRTVGSTIFAPFLTFTYVFRCRLNRCGIVDYS